MAARGWIDRDLRPGVSAPVTIGLDVGGTKVAGGLVDPAGAVVERTVRPSVVGGAADPASRVTLLVARELLARAAELGLRVDGIGAGFPEYVDPDGRLTSREVLAWTDQPAQLLARLGPVTVESDVRCGALAEALLGAGREAREMIYVSAGTGLSYALVVDGRPRPGRRGEAIAFGELEVSPAFAGPSVVTLERYASGGAIGRAWAEATGRPVAGAQEVAQAAAAGDATAIALLERTGGALGAGLALLVRLLDPDLIVLGGGLGISVGPWRAALEVSYAARTASRSGAPPVVTSALGPDAGVIGAALTHRRATARG